VPLLASSSSSQRSAMMRQLCACVRAVGADCDVNGGYEAADGLFHDSLYVRANALKPANEQRTTLCLVQRRKRSLLLASLESTKNMQSHWKRNLPPLLRVLLLVSLSLAAGGLVSVIFTRPWCSPIALSFECKVELDEPDSWIGGRAMSHDIHNMIQSDLEDILGDSMDSFGYYRAADERKSCSFFLFHHLPSPSFIHFLL